METPPTPEEIEAAKREKDLNHNPGAVYFALHIGVLLIVILLVVIVAATLRRQG